MKCNSAVWDCKFLVWIRRQGVVLSDFIRSTLNKGKPFSVGNAFVAICDIKRIYFLYECLIQTTLKILFYVIKNENIDIIQESRETDIT